MPTTTITLAFEVSYDPEHETEQGAREDLFRILEEAEQAGFFERQTIEATYAEVTTAPSLREMRKEMLAEGTEFSVCAACGAEIIRHPDGPWYHWTTGTEGYVDDPTGTDAMHKVVLAADNPDSVKSTESAEPLPDYIWPDPSGTGWIDAWNGWYDTLERALEDATGGGARPWILNKGEGLVDEDERERRDALRKLLADWFKAELFRISETGTSSEWTALIDDAKARHETFGLPWTNEFVPDYVREIMALSADD